MSKPPYRTPLHKRVITEDRALQILNDVSEYWWEDGRCDFATKPELCQAIHWLRDQHREELARKDSALEAISRITSVARLYLDDSKLEAAGVSTLKDLCNEEEYLPRTDKEPPF